MIEVGVHEAKTNFSTLLARVEAGEEVYITNRNKRVARLVPLEKQGVTVGSLAHLNVVLDMEAFNAPDAEILAAVETGPLVAPEDTAS